MDYSFHLQQGLILLENQDATSIKKALEHIKTANEMAEDEHLGKPQILYYLALGNLMIGNVEQSFKVAHKAKRSIDTVIRNSKISLNNMRQAFSEDGIDSLINHISQKYPEFVLFTDTEDDDFDVNELDFSHVSKLYQSIEKQEVKPQFSINSLDEEVIKATFMGLTRTNEQLIYFDKFKGDVLSYLQGYFSSHIGDQSVANRRLANRITNNEMYDLADEDRYILIDHLRLTEFLNEYKIQTKRKEPFSSFVDYFSEEVIKDLHDKDLTIDNLFVSSYIQEKFHEIFDKKYQDRVLELRDDYTNIFESTCKSVAINWIKNKILNGIEENKPSLEADNSFKFHKKYFHSGHVPIIDFFKKNGFHTNNFNVTYLSILSTTDRCVILEELFNPKILDSILSDKLLLAYVTSGKIELAEKVIDNSIINGESDINVWGLNSKLELGLAPTRNRDQRLVIYNDFLLRTENPLEIEFLNLLIEFCKKHYD